MGSNFDASFLTQLEDTFNKIHHKNIDHSIRMCVSHNAETTDPLLPESVSRRITLSFLSSIDRHDDLHVVPDAYGEPPCYIYTGHSEINEHVSVEGGYNNTNLDTEGNEMHSLSDPDSFESSEFDDSALGVIANIVSDSEDSDTGALMTPQRSPMHKGLATPRSVGPLSMPLHEIYVNPVIVEMDAKHKENAVRQLHSSEMAGTRLFFVQNASMTPLEASNVIPFRGKDVDSSSDEEEEVKKQQPMILATERKSIFFGQRGYLRNKAKQKNGVSFGHLLPMPSAPYDPSFLDDNSISQYDDHRVTYRFEGMMESVISFTKADKLKAGLNQQFRLRHPWLDASMSLSKIRKVKSDMFRVGKLADLELSTVALAYVYFEKLVLANKVTKQTRKLLAGTCMILAFKHNEALSPEGSDKEHFIRFVEGLSEVFLKTKTQMLSAEFKVFAALNFDLHIDPKEVLSHLAYFQNLAN